MIRAESSTANRCPPAAILVMVHILFERFSYYGIKTIFVLYFKEKLKFTEDASIVLFHAYCSYIFFICVFTAIIADSWLGKYKTIVILLLFHTLSGIFLAIFTIGLAPYQVEYRIWIIVALFAIATGSGGAKPCMAAFGGDQFDPLTQITAITIFFSLVYLAVKLGGLLAAVIVPILRSVPGCVDESQCYIYAFAAIVSSNIISSIIFGSGHKIYRKVKPQGNMVFKTVQCIAAAISKRRTSRGQSGFIRQGEHWLDSAIPDYGFQLVDEIRTLLNILTLYIPLPMFWALYDQQASRWIFQANRMDGNFSNEFGLKPDQLLFINPVLVLILIPSCDYVIYPILNRLNLFTRPLQKITIGGFLAGIAFLVAAIIEHQIEYRAANNLARLHMMWLVPQYFLMTLGEVFFGVTGVEFSYAEAPCSMKTVIQGAWLLTASLGNLLVIIITEITSFQSQFYDFILYAVLIFIATVAFMFLARSYKSITGGYARRLSRDPSEVSCALRKYESLTSLTQP